jgi:DNA-binding Xre family transcriptional regulator
MRPRLRLRESLTRRDMTVYRLLQLSEGRLTRSWLYAIYRSDGEYHTLTADQLSCLCDLLDVTAAELVEYRPRRHR